MPLLSLEFLQLHRSHVTVRLSVQSISTRSSQKEFAQQHDPLAGVYPRLRAERAGVFDGGRAGDRQELPAASAAASELGQDDGLLQVSL